MDIIPAKKQNVIIDASTFNTYDGCARLGNFQYNMHLVPITGKSKSQQMGTIVHRIAEIYYKARIDGLGYYDAVDAALKDGKEFITKPEITISHDDTQLAYNTMVQYFEFYKNDHWVPLECEQVDQAQIYEDDNMRIIWKAKYDLKVDTNESRRPVDHKSMSQRRDTNELNVQFMGQCFLMGVNDIYINKIGFQTSLKPHEKFVRFPIHYSAEKLFEWQSETIPYGVMRMLEYEQTGFYPPRYSHCDKFGRCIFYEDVCNVNPNLREEGLKNNFVVGEAWDPDNA